MTSNDLGSPRSVRPEGSVSEVPPTASPCTSLFRYCSRLHASASWRSRCSKSASPLFRVPPPLIACIGFKEVAMLQKKNRPLASQCPLQHASAHHGAPSCLQVRPLPREVAPRARARSERAPHSETSADGLDSEVHHVRPVCAHLGARNRRLRVSPMARRRSGSVLACTCSSRRLSSPCTFGGVALSQVLACTCSSRRLSSPCTFGGVALSV